MLTPRIAAQESQSGQHDHELNGSDDYMYVCMESTVRFSCMHDNAHTPVGVRNSRTQHIAVGAPRDQMSTAASAWPLALLATCWTRAHASEREPIADSSAVRSVCTAATQTSA